MRVPRIIGNWSSGPGDNSSDVITAADVLAAVPRISAIRQIVFIRWRLYARGLYICYNEE